MLLVLYCIFPMYISCFVLIDVLSFKGQTYYLSKLKCKSEQPGISIVRYKQHKAIPPPRPAHHPLTDSNEQSTTDKAKQRKQPMNGAAKKPKTKHPVNKMNPF